LDAERWLAVADGIRRDRCTVQSLSLVIIQGAGRFEAVEAVQAVLRAIRVDSNLEHRAFEMGYGLTNEAGVALAEALAVNKTLRMSSVNVVCSFVYDELGAPAYEAFSAMLRVNTSLALKLPPFKTDDADAKLLESRNQMVIEQRLNKLGRGKVLAPRLTTRVWRCPPARAGLLRRRRLSRFPSQLPVQLAPLALVSYLRVTTHSKLLQYNFCCWNLHALKMCSNCRQ
jgi:hypothetical protein